MKTTMTTGGRRRTARKLRRAAWIAVALGATPMVAFSQTTQEVLTNLAQQIADRRGRVESLSEEVAQTRERYNEEVRSLAAQIADVEIQINRERLRLQQIEQDVERLAEEAAVAEGAVIDVEPIVRTALARYRSYVETALPFQVEDRLDGIDRLEDVLEDGNVDPQTVLTRLWNTVQSEYRLTGESGLFRQTIVVNGEEQLAEVARLGMVLMYFRTFDDRYGVVVPSGDEWRYVLVEDRTAARQIAELFDGLRRNLREGFFTLPNPYEGDL
jgi:hypothetical protein